MTAIGPECSRERKRRRRQTPGLELAARCGRGSETRRRRGRWKEGAWTKALGRRTPRRGRSRRGRWQPPTRPGAAKGHRPAPLPSSSLEMACRLLSSRVETRGEAVQVQCDQLSSSLQLITLPQLEAERWTLIMHVSAPRLLRSPALRATRGSGEQVELDPGRRRLGRPSGASEPVMTGRRWPVSQGPERSGAQGPDAASPSALELWDLRDSAASGVNFQSEDFELGRARKAERLVDVAS